MSEATELFAWWTDNKQSGVDIPEDQISDNPQYASPWIPTCAVENVDNAQNRKKTQSPHRALTSLSKIYMQKPYSS